MDGKSVLQFAAAYGFRNIQNLVQKLKRKKCQYHYVEVMACPSGQDTCTDSLIVLVHRLCEYHVYS